MTYVFSSSLTPTNGGDTMFKLKTALVNVGWTVVSSSNGTTLSSGDTITTLAALTNSNAYFIVKEPLAATSSYGNVQREFGVQRGAANTSWRIDYTVSSSHQFGGTATTMASGSDRKWVFESGGFQNGAVGTLFITDATYRMHICTDNAPPFGFYAVTVPISGGNPNCIVFDPLLSGSFHPNDLDPTIQWAQGDSAAFLFSATNGSNASTQNTASNLTPRGWLVKTSTSESYSGFQVPVMTVWNASSVLTLAAANMSVNHIDGSDDVYPIYYLKPSNAGGVSSIKGISSLFSGSWTVRSSADTLSIVTSKDFIIFRHFVAVWGGTTPTL